MTSCRYKNESQVFLANLATLGVQHPRPGRNITDVQIYSLSMQAACDTVGKPRSIYGKQKYTN